MWRRIGLRGLGFAIVAFVVFVLMAAATGITTRQTRTAAPGNFAGTTAEGTSLSHARADHVHTPTSTSQVKVDAGLFGATPSFKAQGSGLLLGDPDGATAQPEGVWIGFHDFGIAHSTIKQLPTGPAVLRMCDSSSSGPPACDTSSLLDFTPSTGQVASTGTNRSLFLEGNRSAADSGADVIIGGAATRTGGSLLLVQNNTTTNFRVDFDGTLVSPSTASGNWIFDTSGVVRTNATNGFLTIRGNRNAADAGTDVVATSTTTRTAGNLFEVQNNGTSHTRVSSGGTLTSTDISCTSCIDDGSLTSNYSGVGSCSAGQGVTAVNDNAAPTCASNYDQVGDEGTVLTQRRKLNFIGAGVSCVDDAVTPETDCTIAGGGSSTGTYTFLQTTSAASTDGGAYVSVSALQIATVANVRYGFYCELAYNTDATTEGLGISIGPGPLSGLSVTTQIQAVANGTFSTALYNTIHHTAVDGGSTTTSTPTATTRFSAVVHGNFQQDGTAETTGIRFRDEVATNGTFATIEGRSWCVYWTV